MNHQLAHQDRTEDRRALSIPSTIVVPVDATASAERALAAGADWARALGAELLVLTVAGEKRREPLADAVGRVDAPSASWHEIADRPALVPSVLEVVAARPSSVVCVATATHAPDAAGFHDDAAQQILRAVEVPVMLVGQHGSSGVAGGPIVVADDASVAPSPVFEHARSWAAALGLPLVVFHVQHPTSSEVVGPVGGFGDIRRRLGPGVPLETVRHSFPAGAIRDYAHEADASLVALSTRGRTGTVTASTGRTAAWVVRESPCPVLVAHPPTIRGS